MSAELYATSRRAANPQLSPNPDLSAIIQWVHREPDGWVSFHNMRGGRFRDVGSVSVKELRGEGQPLLPSLIEQLAEDGLFSINGWFRPGYVVRRRRTWTQLPLAHPEFGTMHPNDFPGAKVATLGTYVERTRPNTGLRHAYREQAGARWLTACWVDCDGWAVGKDASDTVAGIHRAYRAGDIPVPTFILGSGRGAWAVYQLVDERNPGADDGPRLLHHAWHRPDTPCRASSRTVRRQQQVNAALAARLAHLGADGAASDTARCCRVPGSVNSKADRVVEILPVVINGALAAYTLSELAAWFDITEDRPRATNDKRQLSAAKQQQCAEAQQARDRKVFNALVALGDHRGGVRDGWRRHLTLFHLCLHGSLAGIPEATLEAEARRFAAACRPPLVPWAVRDALKSGRKLAARIFSPPVDHRPPRRPRYDTLARTLLLTADERAAIGLVANQPKDRPQATAQRQRQAAILSLVARLPEVPSTVAMSEHLRALGFKASQPTIALDYRQLGLVSVAARGGRPTKPTGQPDIYADL